MSPFFHGIGLSIIGCLVVTLGLSIFTKLGVRFMAALVAVTTPVLLIAQLLSIWGAEPRPYVLLVLVVAPAVAGWLSARMLRGGPDDEPSVDPGRQTSAAASRRSNFGRTHHFGQIFVR